TDLSKLGKPGQHFVHDFFLPGTQLTFSQSATKQIASVSGVAAVSSGLTLIAEHQEGVVPKIVAKLKAGGQRINVDRQLAPPTAAEFAQIQSCIAKARAASGQSGGSNGSGNGGNGFGSGDQQSGPGGGGFAFGVGR